MPSFLDWWYNQLAAFIPAGFARTTRRPSDAVVLEADRGVLRAVARVNGARTRLAELRPDEMGFGELRRLLSATPKLPRTIVLRPQPSQVLHKLVTLPAAARGNLDSVLGFEIDRETPFTRDEVYWSYRPRPSAESKTQLDVDLFLVPRGFVDPLVNQMKRAGIVPSGIEADLAPGVVDLIALGPASGNEWFRLERPLVPYAVSAAGLAVLAIVTPLLVQQWILMRADAAVASLTGAAREAATLRQTIDQATLSADFLKREKGENRSAVSIIAAITDALPDDTYLTSLSIRNGKVTMSGYSSAAADLIAVLAEAPGFGSPSFDAPVVRNEETSLESFTISVTLAEAGTS